MALLTIPEAVKLAGLTSARIRKLLNDGRIMGTKIDGTTWVVNSQSLEAYLAGPRRPGRPVGWRKPRRESDA